MIGMFVISFCVFWWDILKDIVIPSLAIAIPVVITLIVTHIDRRDNAKSRKEDLHKYEQDKLEAIALLDNERKNRELSIWNKLEGNLGMAVATARSHIDTIDKLIEQSEFSRSGTLSTVILVNEHLQGLLNLDYREISLKIDGVGFLRYLNSIKIIDRIYWDIMDWNKRYKIEHRRLSGDFDDCLQSLFFTIEKLRFDDEFSSKVFEKLELFKIKYDKFVSTYSLSASNSSAKTVMGFKNIFIDEYFMRVDTKYNYVHDVVLDLEKSLTKLERLSESSVSQLRVLKDAMVMHLGVLQEFGEEHFVAK